MERSSTNVSHFQSILRHRQLTVDPTVHLSTFKKKIYSPGSFVRRLKLEKQLHSHEGCVNCISFSHDGHLLVSGSDDLHIVLWDWSKGKIVGKFDSKHVANVFQTKFMPHTNDSVLVSAARDGQVRCHVISTTGGLASSKRVAYHNDSAHKLALEQDNPHVFLSCGEDGSVLEIDLREDVTQRNKILVCKNDKNIRIALYSIFIDPSNYNRFAVSGRDQYARIYDRRYVQINNKNKAQENSYADPLQKFCPNHLENPEGEFRKANITCLVYSHDGKELLCSYNDEDIYTFDTSNTSTGEYLRTFQGHRNNATVKGVNYFGLESEYVVSGSDCGHVFLWNKETQNIVQYFAGDEEGVVNCLEPHPHMPVLAVSGLDHDIKVFTPSADQPTDLNGIHEVTSRNMERRKASADFVPDGYDLILSFIMRQYRRGIRRRAGIEEENTGSSASDDEMNDEDSEEEEEEGERDDEEEGRIRRIRWRRPRRYDDDDDSDEDGTCVQS